jgi:hypothetical protein
MIRVGCRAVLNNYSEACAFLELALGYFCDVGAAPRFSILGFRIVVKPSVVGRVRPGLCLPGIKIYPATQRMAQLINGVHGEVYTPEQSSSLYPTAGDTTDWTYGTYGIPSYTIELRPSDVAGGGFILPAEQIQPTWEENRVAALEFIAQAL